MHEVVLSKVEQVADVCRQHNVVRLEVFGSAARARDFDPAHSDIDLLVEFAPGRSDLGTIVDLQERLESVLERPVDLIERAAVERSRNHIRRERILSEAQLLYAA